MAEYIHQSRIPGFDNFIEVSGTIINGVATKPKRRRTGVDHYDRQGGLHLAYRKLVVRARDEDDIKAVLDEVLWQFNGTRGDLRTADWFDHHVYPVRVLPGENKECYEDGFEDWMTDIPETGLEADLHLLFPHVDAGYAGVNGKVRLFESQDIPRHLVTKRMNEVELAIRRYAKEFPPGV